MAFLKSALEEGTDPELLAKSLRNANLPERHLFEAMRLLREEQEKPAPSPSSRLSVFFFVYAFAALLALLYLYTFSVTLAGKGLSLDTAWTLVHAPLALFSSASLAWGVRQRAAWVCGAGGWLVVANALASLFLTQPVHFVLWFLLFVALWACEDYLAPRPVRIPGVTIARV